jgi:hypothetical protein
MATQAKATRKTIIEQCDAGLLKICTPIFVGDEFVGIIGGCGRLPAGEEVDTFTVEKATGLPHDEVMALAAQVPAITMREAEDMARFLEDFVKRRSHRSAPKAHNSPSPLQCGQGRAAHRQGRVLVFHLKDAALAGKTRLPQRRMRVSRPGVEQPERKSLDLELARQLQGVIDVAGGPGGQGIAQNIPQSLIHGLVSGHDAYSSLDAPAQADFLVPAIHVTARGIPAETTIALQKILERFCLVFLTRCHIPTFFHPIFQRPKSHMPMHEKRVRSPASGAEAGKRAAAGHGPGKGSGTSSQIFIKRVQHRRKALLAPYRFHEDPGRLAHATPHFRITNQPAHGLFQFLRGAGQDPGQGLALEKIADGGHVPVVEPAMTGTPCESASREDMP